MENQLFTWDGYDPIDEGINQYYNCTLTKDMQVRTGYVDIIPIIVMDYTKSTMEFMNSTGRIFRTYDLVLSVK